MKVYMSLLLPSLSLVTSCGWPLGSIQEAGFCRGLPPPMGGGQVEETGPSEDAPQTHTGQRALPSRSTSHS
jgi:hypothetical protein